MPLLGGASKGSATLITRFGGTSLRQPAVPPNRLDLLEVIDIVSGEVHRDVADGFYAALGMHSEQFPFLRAQRAKQGEVRLSEDAKNFQRQAHIGSVVPSGARPDVLIECLNGRSGRREDHSQAIPANKFIVSKVGHDFLN